MKKLSLTLLIFLLSFTAFSQSASYSTSTVSTQCWTTNPVIATATQQNSIAVFENFVYVVFYNSDRYLCISRSDNYGNGGWKTIQLNHRYEKRNGVWDSHNTPNIVISPIDKRIHLSFDMHKRDLRYMLSWANTATISNSEFTASRFSSVRNYLEANKTKITDVTYPRFFVGRNQHLFFMYRKGGSGNGDTYMVKYNNDATWGKPFEIIDGNIGTHNGSGSRCAYFNDVQFHAGKIHLTWVWRETSNADTNHDLMYAYSGNDGVSWKNSNGEYLSMPMNLNSPGLKVATIPTNTGLINHNGCAVDGDGNVHTVLRINGGYHHYYGIKGSDGKFNWSSRTVATFGGDRPKLYCDRSSNTLYLMVRSSTTLRLYATVSNNKNWNQWKEIKSFSDKFSSTTNSIINSSGNKLTTMAVSSDARLQVVHWALSPSSNARTLGVTEESLLEDKKIRIYPNPTSSSFTIDFGQIENAEVLIYNQLGQRVYQDDVSERSLRLSKGNTFSKGIYLINFIDKSTLKVYQEKLVIQ
ncbi:BNR-4 repeat-containing protein [Flammeovirga yaeyamensis]|uniref:BNR-4 repeat-containing protein n=1 Tax=Flammeovirga yaeyamensis TaxID=367791 RepID=A0AAX1NFL1_9BACT|nr:BNR-4 repeat-containing protein [Flammeovirga yaeyamensis]MBB3696647.1 hypothetical protein [Flammeovirga yaeyamensis]NMF33320.1 T9SS type A sorting domain-containing protein [Flammeovirga yaeyamensis]QWG05403.1 BNR-4 repeat-containing protein [Flammeovirga yaeyamensis]